MLPAHAYPLLFAVAAVSGWIDAVAGSGGLLQLPVLLLLGRSLPVPTLLGTNKLPATVSKTFAALTYTRRHPVDRAVAIRCGLAATTGSAGGAVFALGISTAFLRPIILGLLVVVALFILFRPRFGEAASSPTPSATPDESRTPAADPADPADLAGTAHRASRRTAALALLGSSAIGFYDGMAGPGSGTFLIILFTTLMAQEFVRVLSTATWINLGTNLGALTVFAVRGDVLWTLGLGMAAFSMAGAIIGARMTLNRGSRFIRIVLLLVITCTALRLAMDQFD